MKVAIHQPLFIPWIGYFHKIMKSDFFVLLDHVQYTKGSWINRNRILGKQGEIMLSVPVQKGPLDQTIIDVIIDQRNGIWKKKHINSIISSYGKSAHFQEIIDLVKVAYDDCGESIASFNISFIKLICEYIGIGTTLIRSSELLVDGNKSDLLLSICNTLQADEYIIGMGGNNSYMDFDLFEKNSIRIINQEIGRAHV